MNTSLKTVLSLVAFGLALAPLARAADEQPSLQVPIPAAPEAADAQGRKAKGERGNGPLAEELKQMKDRLQLTDDQSKQIAGIWRNHASEMKAAQGDRAKLAEIRQQQRSEVRAVLTSDQQKKFDEMTPARGKGKGKGKGKKDKDA